MENFASKKLTQIGIKQQQIKVKQSLLGSISYHS